MTEKIRNRYTILYKLLSVLQLFVATPNSTYMYIYLYTLYCLWKLHVHCVTVYSSVMGEQPGVLNIYRAGAHVAMVCARYI